LNSHYRIASLDELNQRLSLDFVSDVVTEVRQFRSRDMLAFKKHMRALLRDGRDAIAKL